MDDYEEETEYKTISKKNNTLPLWGNERTMNLNPLILTNIQSSHYFKVNLYELKTYHEVIDEIYYKVNHVEPWEKGSRKTAGQTGMCGGVRGVGAGGIVSTAFCLLYKLFTLKLSRKQVIGLITHPDSPYIRVLGFMYIRYTQPPADLWDWYDEYLEDQEEVDVKAGGGQVMMIGNILKNFLCKLEWFSTLFPRIPVPIQQKIERKMSERFPSCINRGSHIAGVSQGQSGVTDDIRHSSDRGCSASNGRSAFRDDVPRRNSRERSRISYDKEDERYSRRHRSRTRSRSKSYNKDRRDGRYDSHRRREHSRSVTSSRDDKNDERIKRIGVSRIKDDVKEESREHKRRHSDDYYKKEYLDKRDIHKEKHHQSSRERFSKNNGEDKHRKEIDDIIRRHEEKQSRHRAEDSDHRRKHYERDRSYDKDDYKHKKHSHRRSSSHEKKSYTDGHRKRYEY